jgi:hypothetical protein
MLSTWSLIKEMWSLAMRTQFDSNKQGGEYLTVYEAARKQGWSISLATRRADYWLANNRRATCLKQLLRSA